MGEINLSANANLERGKQAAKMVFILFAVYALIAGCATFAVTLSVQMAGYALGGIGGAGTLLATFLLVHPVMVGQGWVSGAVRTYLPEEPDDFVDSLATPPARELSAPTLPALPTEDYDDTIQYTSSRGVVQIPRKTLHGFEIPDLEWLCKYLENGGKWTEAAMEKLPLPYSKEMMGKAAEGTKYTAFMELCTEAGIIVGREGKKSGNLAVMDAAEMLMRIKALPA